MSALRRANAILARIEDGIAGLVLAAVLGVVVYELTVRGIFGSPTCGPTNCRACC